MYLHGRSLRLRKQRPRSNPRRIIILLALILGGVFVIGLNAQGQVQPLFVPTATATRIPESYGAEAAAQFASGNLKAAIAAYRRATVADPKNLAYWVELARVG